MANHKSSEKRVRQTAKRNAINRSNRGELRTKIKGLRSLIAGNDKDGSVGALGSTISIIDKAVNKGLIHRNTAARYKSRLTRRVAGLS